MWGCVRKALLRFASQLSLNRLFPVRPEQVLMGDGSAVILIPGLLTLPLNQT